MNDLVSQRQFAKEVGRSNVWVSRLVKEGKIPVDSKGRISLKAGKEAYLASQQVGYDSNRAHGEKQRKLSKKTSNEKKPDAENIQDEEEQEAPFTSVTDLSIQKVNQAYNRAKLAEKTFQAKLKEIEYKEAQGHLVLKEDVIRDAKETAEELRSLFLGIPSRTAALCEGKPAREIEGIIEDAINEAFSEIYKSKFLKAEK